MNLYLGLVHYPIVNKRGEIIRTSVTNLDIHDISRSCRTFGVKKYFIITPIEAQHKLIKRILGHWEEDKSCVYNPDRFDALACAVACHDIEEAKQHIESVEGKNPFIVTTSASAESFDGDVKALKNKNLLDKMPVLLLFGTGWGLSASVMESSDFVLEPIYSKASDGYNHLSVRSAVAIYLNRIREASGLK